ncbi:MAG TPA: serine/threonine-protein kinase, partial [Gemmataceae bacterium]
MGYESTPHFLDAVRASGLLGPDQLEELARRPAPPPSGDDLGAYLRERGWLTDYQLEQIRQGEGHRLVFAGYRILEKLGEAASGDVCKAYHPALRRPVVLKDVRPDRLPPGEPLADYLARAQAASLLSHPHLVNVLDAGQFCERPFVVVEYFDGADLGWLVRSGGPLPAPQACAYLRQAALALEYAHRKQLYHGDLQPGSLLVTPVEPAAPGDGSPGLRPAPGAAVKVMDVGLIPAGGWWFGHLPHQPPEMRYRAPERFAGAKPDVLADVYGLGGVLYFALSGRAPFAGGGMAEALSRKLTGPGPEPLAALRPDLPAGLAELVGRMLARDPLQRPGSAAEVAAALAAYADPGAEPSEPLPAEVHALLASATDSPADDLPPAAAPDSAVNLSPPTDFPPAGAGGAEAAVFPAGDFAADGPVAEPDVPPVPYVPPLPPEAGDAPERLFALGHEPAGEASPRPRR